MVITSKIIKYGIISIVVLGLIFLGSILFLFYIFVVMFVIANLFTIFSMPHARALLPVMPRYRSRGMPRGGGRTSQANRPDG